MQPAPSTPATSELPISPIERIVASLGDRWCCTMLRSTFSHTTIASSTTMPMARIRPNSVSRLIEKPSASMPLKVPTSETTMAMAQISVVRRLCKNR